MPSPAARPVHSHSFMRLAVTLIVLVCLALALAVTDADAANKKKKKPAPQPQRYAALVIDATTGKVLHQENADARRHPASLTKMMTLYMTFAALERGQMTLNQRLFVSPQAASQSPSKLGLRSGDRLRVEDAILGLVTQSANDASVVLAEAMGGSEARFAQQMTATARKLGMSNTVFKNASGLPNPQQITTARDMAKLALALLRHYPQYYHYFSTPVFQYEGESHRNHNRLMARFEGMDGIKTGFINASGFNLVASAVRDGNRLVGVIFGGRSAATRDNQLEKLMIESFDRAREMDRAPQMVQHEAPVKTANFDAPVPPRKPQALTATSNASASFDNSLTTAAAVPTTATAVSMVAGEGEMGMQAQPAVVTRDQVKSLLAAQPADAWGIQIGAYNDRAAAQRALAITADQNAELLGRGMARVMAVDTPTGTIYRARLIGLDQRVARQACARLQRQNRPCLTLPPATMAAAGGQTWLAADGAAQ